MFATTPLFAPLHHTLASHVFGRFMPRSSLQGAGREAVVPAGAVAGNAVEDEDAVPDLAQRVRETGEW